MRNRYLTRNLLRTWAENFNNMPLLAYLSYRTMTCETSIATTNISSLSSSIPLPCTSGEFFREIFHVKEWHKGKKSLPPLEESNPLSMFLHADEYLNDSIRNLFKYRGHFDLKDRKFVHLVDCIHRAQKVVLDCLYIMYTELPENERRERNYLSDFPEDQQYDIANQFSEHVLYAAQAISHGFQLTGIHDYPVPLYESAVVLMSQWDAIRYVFRLQSKGRDTTNVEAMEGGTVSGGSNQEFDIDSDAKSSENISKPMGSVTKKVSGMVHFAKRHFQLHRRPSWKRACGVTKDTVEILQGRERWFRGSFGKKRERVVKEFVEAWCTFEDELTQGYARTARSFRQKLELDIQEKVEEGRYWVEQLSCTLEKAKKTGLFSSENIETLSPEVLWSTPRLAILYSLREKETTKEKEKQGQADEVLVEGQIEKEEEEALRYYQYFFDDKLNVVRDVRLQVTDLAEEEVLKLQRRFCSSNNNNRNEKEEETSSESEEVLFRCISFLADELSTGPKAICWREILQAAFEKALAASTTLK